MWYDMSFGFMDGGRGLGGYWLGMGLHGLFWFLLVAAIAIMVIWVARAANRPNSVAALNNGPKPGDILDARYARGEIEWDDYLLCKRYLDGQEK